MKQHLTSIISELKNGDEQQARQMIIELASLQVWEDKYRQFQLCDKLRSAALKLEGNGLYDRIYLSSFNNPEMIKQKMWDYIGGERSVANSVSAMLLRLSDLEREVDSNANEVIESIEIARNEIAKYRQDFIDFEKEIRL